MRNLLFCFIFLITTLAWSNELDQAPPNFPFSDSQAVFIDFVISEIDLHLGVTAKTAEAKVKVTFFQSEAGYPLFDLVPSVDSISLDGKTQAVESFINVTTPGNTTMRSVQVILALGYHTMEFEYSLGYTNLRFSPEGVKLGLFLTDLGSRRFLEQYFPANMEYN